MYRRLVLNGFPNSFLLGFQFYASDGLDSCYVFHPDHIVRTKDNIQKWNTWPNPTKLALKCYPESFRNYEGVSRESPAKKPKKQA